MPFTLAHPALVLPLRRSRLPLAALVAGSLAPDLPLFLPTALVGSRDEGHSWTHTWLGMGAFCLPVGVMLTLAWVFLLQDPVTDGAPDAVRGRLAAPPRPDRGYWLATVPAVALGVLGHVGWDQLTHEGTWLGEHWALLRTDVAGLPVSRWLMYACSVLGLAAIALAAWRTLAARRPRPSARVVPALAPWVLPAPVAAAVAAAIYRLVTVGPYITGAHALAYDLLTAGIGAAALVLAVAAVAWHLATPVAPGQPGLGHDDPAPADGRAHLVP